MDRKMDKQNEVEVLNSIFEEINASKLDVIFKTASFKVKNKLLYHYRSICEKKRQANITAQEAIAHRIEKRIKLMNHLEGLRSMNHSLENYNIELNRSLNEQKEKNRRYQEDTENIMKKYKDKWIQRKLEYDSTELAIERTKVKGELKVLEFKLMEATHTLNDLKMAAKQYCSINTQRSQNIIIASAKFMVDSVQKQNVIDSLQRSIEENNLKYQVSPEKLKKKLINDEMRSSSTEEEKPDCNLPVKLKFTEYNLSDPRTYQIPLEIQESQTKNSNSNNTIYTDVKPKPLPVNIFKEKSAWHNVVESQLDKPGCSNSPRPLFATENALNTILKKDSFLPQQKLSSGGEKRKKLTQPKETGINEEKKVKILKNVVLKPEEKFIFFKSMQINKQFDGNSVNIDNTNKEVDSLIVNQQMADSAMVQSNIVDKNTNVPLIPENRVEDKSVSQVEEVEDFQQKAKKIKLHDDIIIKNDVNPPCTVPKPIEKVEMITFQMLSTKLFPDKVDNSEHTATETKKMTEYLQEKNTLMEEFDEKYNHSKSPEFTYGLTVKPKQKFSQSGNTSESKFFSNLEIGQGDNISAVVPDDNETDNATATAEPADAPTKQSVSFLKPMDGGIFAMQIDNEYGSSAQHKMETSTKHYGTQNTFISDYSSSMMRYSDSQSEDDCSMLNAGMDFPMLTKDVDCLEGGHNIDKQFLETSTKHYGTQNTFISDYSSSMMRYSDSQSEDDCSMLNAGMDFPMLTKDVDCLEGGHNIDKQFQPPHEAFDAGDSANKAFDLFGNGKSTEKDKSPVEEKPQRSGFKSQEKTNKGSFFNLFD